MASNTIFLNVQTNADDATKDLNKIDDGVDKIKGSTKELSEETKKTGMNWTELSSKINVFKEAFGAVKDTFAKIYEVSKELVQEFEKVNNQMTILKSQKAWGDIKIQFDQLENATGGVIDKFDILESVNKAVSFGIDLSGNKLLDLVKLSGKAALNMGVDLKFAFDSLIVGTARESKMILDNLGVMVDVTKANEDYAKSIGKTADALTEEESKTALLNNVISELNRTQASIEDDTLKASGTGFFARAQRTWRDVKLASGEALSELAEYVDELFMDMADKGAKHFNQALKDEQINRNEAVSENVKVLTDLGTNSEQMITLLKEEEDIYLQQKQLIDDIGKKKEIQAFAEKSVAENTKMSYGQIRDQETVNFMLINELRTKYGEKVAAQYEMEIGNGQRSFELAKKRGEFSDNAEFNTLEFLKKQGEEISTASSEALTWAIHLADVEDAWTRMWDLMQEDVVKTRGSQTVEDATIENMKKNDEKVQKLSSKLSNKRAQKKIDDAEELAKMMRKWNEEEAKLDREIAIIDSDLKNEIEMEKERNKIKAMKELQKMEIEDKKEQYEKMKIQRDAKFKEDELALEAFLFNENQKKKEAQEESEKIQNMGNAVFTAAANSVYNDLISGQEDFLQRAAAVALQTAGSQIFADGIKNVWLGGGQILATGGLKGWETVAYGVAEMGAGVALGYAGNQVMPDTASNEGSSATEQNKTEQNSYTFNVTASLYGTKKEAQKGLNEVMR